MAAATKHNAANADADGTSGAQGAPPRELPPRSAAEISALVANADRTLLRLDGALSAVPSRDLYLAMHRRREAALSARLAGYPSTLANVLSACVNGSSDGGAASDCLRAIEIATVRAGTRPFSAAEIAKLHSTFKASNRADVPQGSEPSRSTADREKLRGVTEILNGCRRNPEGLPPLACIGLAQGRLESWRPFPYANGRMGRALLPALAEQLGIPGARALGISGFLVERTSDYRQAQAAIGSEAEWMPWLTLFLEGVVQNASETAEAIRQFADLRERHRSAIGKGFGHATVRGLRVLERLFAEPYTSITDVRGITGTSFVAANQLASRLVDLGILEEVTGYRRNRVFRYGAFVRLFEEVPSGSGESASIAIAPDRSPGNPNAFQEPGRTGTGPKRERALDRQRTAPKPARRRSEALDDFLL